MHLSVALHLSAKGRSRAIEPQRTSLIALVIKQAGMFSCKRAYYPTAGANSSSPRLHKRFKATATRVFSSATKTAWSDDSNPTSGEEDSDARPVNRFSRSTQVNTSGAFKSIGYGSSSNEGHGSSDHDDGDDTRSSLMEGELQPCGVSITDDGQIVFAEDEEKIKPNETTQVKAAGARRSKLPRLRVKRRGGDLSFDSQIQRWVANNQSGDGGGDAVRCLSSIPCVSAVLSVEEIDDRIMMLMDRIEQDKPWQFAYRCLRVPFAMDRKNDRMDFMFECWDAFWQHHGHAIWERNYWAPLQVGSTKYNQRKWRQRAAKRAFYELSVDLNAKLGLPFWYRLRREIYEGWWYRSSPFALRRLFQNDRRGFDEYMSRSRHRKRWPRGKKVARGIDPTWCLGWQEGDETTDYEHINSESKGEASDTVSSESEEQSESDIMGQKEQSDNESLESLESDESLEANENLENETDEESPDTKELFGIGASDSDGDGDISDDEFSDDERDMGSSSSSSDSDGPQCDQVNQRSVMMAL